MPPKYRDFWEDSNSKYHLERIGHYLVNSHKELVFKTKKIKIYYRLYLSVPTSAFSATYGSRRAFMYISTRLRHSGMAA
jgi:hypothetical protein